MLASTMHFSNNTHPQHHRISAPHHRTPHQHDNHCKHQDNTTSVFPQNPDSVLAASDRSPGKITQPPTPTGPATRMGVFDVSPSKTQHAVTTLG